MGCKNPGDGLFVNSASSDVSKCSGGGSCEQYALCTSRSGVDHQCECFIPVLVEETMEPVVPPHYE